MPLYNGTALFSADYTVTAEDELQASDFIFEAATEEFPDLEINNIISIEEVK